MTYNEINTFFTKKSIPKYYLPMLEQLLMYFLSIIIAYIAVVVLILFVAQKSANYQKIDSIAINNNLKLNGTNCIFILQNNNIYKNVLLEEKKIISKFETKGFQKDITFTKDSSIKSESNTSKKLIILKGNDFFFNNYEQPFCY